MESVRLVLLVCQLRVPRHSSWADVRGTESIYRDVGTDFPHLCCKGGFTVLEAMLHSWNLRDSSSCHITLQTNTDISQVPQKPVGTLCIREWFGPGNLHFYFFLKFGALLLLGVFCLLCTAFSWDSESSDPQHKTLWKQNIMNLTQLLMLGIFPWHSLNELMCSADRGSCSFWVGGIRIYRWPWISR